MQMTYNMWEYSRILLIAADAHKHQLRKSLGVPYINHPIRVAHAAMESGLTEDAVYAALLHDVVEDTPVTLDDLRMQVSVRTYTIVNLLTKWWGDHDHEAAKLHKPTYYKGILEDREALAIKLLDRADNLDDMRLMLGLDNCSRSEGRWAERYARKTQEEFAPLLDMCNNAFAVNAYNKAMLSLVHAVRDYQDALLAGSRSSR